MREFDRINLSMSLDLGTSATDIWVLEIETTDRWGHFFMEMTWDFRYERGEYVHTLTVNINDDGWREQFQLIISWNPTRGDFDIVRVERVGRDTWTDEILSGNFIVREDGTFRLQFDHEYDGWSWREEFSFDIFTETRADIGDVEFVNIDRWTQALLDQIEDALWDIGR
jgi:hypothetical protein